MIEHSTPRRSFLAAISAAVCSTWLPKSNTIADRVVESSEAVIVAPAQDVYYMPNWRCVELELGGTVLLGDCITWDKIGRAVTWRAGSENHPIGIAKEGGFIGERIAALISPLC